MRRHLTSKVQMWKHYHVLLCQLTFFSDVSLSLSNDLPHILNGPFSCWWVTSPAQRQLSLPCKNRAVLCHDVKDLMTWQIINELVQDPWVLKTGRMPGQFFAISNLCFRAKFPKLKKVMWRPSDRWKPKKQWLDVHLGQASQNRSYFQYIYIYALIYKKKKKKHINFNTAKENQHRR